MLAIGSLPWCRIWRQNCGEIPVRDRSGKVIRVFHPGPPTGAADITGVVSPEGWRIEIEVKSATGKCSKEQENWRVNMAQLGAIYVLVQYDETRSQEDNVMSALAAIERTVETKRLFTRLAAESL